MSQQQIYFSGKSDPEIWLPFRQLGVAGLQPRLVPDMHIVEFCRGSRSVRIQMDKVLILGEKWVTRKLYRFRRYVRRMERQA